MVDADLSAGAEHDFGDELESGWKQIQRPASGRFQPAMWVDCGLCVTAGLQTLRVRGLCGFLTITTGRLKAVSWKFIPAIGALVCVSMDQADAETKAIWEISSHLRCNPGKLMVCSSNMTSCGPWEDHASPPILFDFQKGTVGFEGDKTTSTIEGKRHSRTSDTVSANGKLYSFGPPSTSLSAVVIAPDFNRVWLESMACVASP